MVATYIISMYFSVKSTYKIWLICIKLDGKKDTSSCENEEKYRLNATNTYVGFQQIMGIVRNHTKTVVC